MDDGRRRPICGGEQRESVVLAQTTAHAVSIGFSNTAAEKYNFMLKIQGERHTNQMEQSMVHVHSCGTVMEVIALCVAMCLLRTCFDYFFTTQTILIKQN